MVNHRPSRSVIPGEWLSLRFSGVDQQLSSANRAFFGPGIVASRGRSCDLSYRSKQHFARRHSSQTQKIVQPCIRSYEPQRIWYDPLTRCPLCLSLAVPMFHNVSQRWVLPQIMTTVHLLVSSGDALLSQVQQSGSKEIDMHTWFTRTALEVIGQTGLGYSFDNLSLDAPEHEFSKSAKELV